MNIWYFEYQQLSSGLIWHLCFWTQIPLSLATTFNDTSKKLLERLSSLGFGIPFMLVRYFDLIRRSLSRKSLGLCLLPLIIHASCSIAHLRSCSHRISRCGRDPGTCLTMLGTKAAITAITRLSRPISENARAALFPRQITKIWSHSVGRAGFEQLLRSVGRITTLLHLKN